jgi:hypothetical protein
VTHSKEFVILALASIAIPISTIACPHTGVVGLFVEVRKSVASGRLLNHEGNRRPAGRSISRIESAVMCS